MLPKLQRPDLQSEGRQRSRQLPGLPGGRRARASEQGWQVELASVTVPSVSTPASVPAPASVLFKPCPLPVGPEGRCGPRLPPAPRSVSTFGLDLRRFGPTSVMPGDKSRQQHWPASDTKLCALHRQALGYGADEERRSAHLLPSGRGGGVEKRGRWASSQ